MLAALGLIGPPAMAQQFTFSVDVPTALGGTTYKAYETVYCNGGVYSLVSSLPGLAADANVDGLAVLSDESLLLSFDAPVTVGGNTYGAADIVRYSGGLYTLYKSAASMGLSASANIDALAVHPTSGDPLISFDAPETVGANTFMPADIADAGASLTMFLDASTKGIADDANVIGYEYQTASQGTHYFSFDAPISLGAAVRLPGDIVPRTTLPDQWNPNFFHDAGFPSGSAMTDFFFALPSPPPVPDGDQIALSPVTAAKVGAAIVVNFDRDCEAGTPAKYNLLYGSISNLATGSYALSGSSCDIDPDGDWSYIWTPYPAGDFWFVIVGAIGTKEGSWGYDFVGGAHHERNGTNSSGQCGITSKDTSKTCP
jgi:hypothetical protein